MTATAQAGLAADSDSAPANAEAASEALYAKSAEAFRTIGEAAAELGLKTHVLRFWETKFDNLRPLKRADGRRYYRVEDMEMLRKLQNLLHVQGMTIRGAVKAMGGEVTDEGGEDIMPGSAGQSIHDLQDAVRSAVARGEFGAPDSEAAATTRTRLENLLADLTHLKVRLDAVRNAA